jgi:polysaccharide biosynthesis protein PslH
LGLRARLLFLSHILPDPPDMGAAIRTRNVLRILGSAFDVTALCFWRPTSSAASGTPEQRAARLSAFGDVSAFPIPATDHPVRGAWDHVRSLVTGRPWVWYLHDSRPFRRRLAALVRDGRFDVAHVDSLDLVRYLRALNGIPTVCVHHNVESALLGRMAEAERSRLKRAYIARQAQLVEREERRWCPRVALNVVVSEDDRRQFETIAGQGRYRVFPNGVDVERYQPQDGDTSGLVFVGGLNWFPNRDALEFFREQILPELHRLGDRPQVSWVGQATDAMRRQFDGEGVVLTGYAEDERPYMARARCFVVPLRVGGGTRLKILNAWGMGKAVVSTSLGCEGLETRDGENILIADDPAAFARCVSRVLSDDALRLRLEQNGRATAVRRYSWDAIGAEMVASYRGVARTGP